MLSKIYITLGITFFIHCIAVAQQTHFIKLSPENQTFKNVDFYIDSLIDNRFNKNGIGSVQTGANNKQVLADLEGGFTNSLLNYFKANFPKKSDSQQRIIIIINKFQISEKTRMTSEKGMALVSMTFCKLDSGRLMKAYETSGEAENSGLEVTSGHEKRIQKALHQCLENFISSDWKNAKPLLIEANPLSAIPRENHILTTSQRKRGVYANIQELLSNTPFYTLPFTISKKGDFAVLRETSTGKKLKEAYGFCDGKYLYINSFNYSVKKNYIKVSEEGTYLVWLDHYVSSVEAGVAGGAFGAIGGAVAASDLDCIVLDVRTGVITVADKKGMDKLLSEDAELLKSYQSLNSGKKDVSVQLQFLKKFNQKHSF